MHRKYGFTLIELLVTIAIIVILATLVLTFLGNSRARARNSRAKGDITSMGKSVEVFRNDDTSEGKVISTHNNDFSWAGNAIILSDANPAPHLPGVQVAKAVFGPPSFGFLPLTALFTGTLSVSPANAGYNAGTGTSDNTFPTRIANTPSTTLAYYYGTHQSGFGIHGNMALNSTGDGKYVDLKAGGLKDCYILEAKGLDTSVGVGETNGWFSIIDGTASAYTSEPTCP